jgi:hypothetical protein
MNNTIFWVVIPYSSLRTRRFGGTYSIFRAVSELHDDASHGYSNEKLKFRDCINRRVLMSNFLEVLGHHIGTQKGHLEGDGPPGPASTTPPINRCSKSTQGRKTLVEKRQLARSRSRRQDNVEMCLEEAGHNNVD